jgi:2-oxoglutarate ferredoxin oxidoreductase subunit alpha
VVLAYGSVARSVKRAVLEARGRGLKVGYLRLITIWPFPDKVIKDIAKKKPKAIIFPEMNMGKMVREAERAAGGRADVISLPKPGVELHRPREIYDLIRRVI